MNEVYRPGEDSLFLLEVVEKIPAKRVAEVGVGTGFVLDGYAGVNAPDLAVGTDIEIEALMATRKRMGPSIMECVLCRSCDAFRTDSFELIFFNPPYLKDDDPHDSAVAGGKKGIEVTYDMAKSSGRALKLGGSLFFLGSSLSEWKRLLGLLEGSDMDVERVASLGLFFEELYAFKAGMRSSSQRSL
jgi:HemK-related putative methylase